MGNLRSHFFLSGVEGGEVAGLGPPFYEILEATLKPSAIPISAFPVHSTSFFHSSLNIKRIVPKGELGVYVCIDELHLRIVMVEWVL